MCCKNPVITHTLYSCPHIHAACAALALTPLSLPLKLTGRNLHSLGQRLTLTELPSEFMRRKCSIRYRMLCRPCVVSRHFLVPIFTLLVIHTHPFNGPLSGTTRVCRYQNGKTKLDFTEARDSEWQWHQLGHMQVCTSPQTDNHASTPPLCFFTGRMPFLPPNQQCQSTEGI